jgi:hypothetical protein
MPEHIRALVVVLVLSTALLFIARPAMIQVMPAETFDRWRKLWLFTTLAWFLSGIIWIYVALMVVMLTRARKKEPQVFGLYLLLLFAAPSAHAPIPGFGLIDHVIMLDHYRLLALALLLPTAWALKKDTSTVRFGRSPVDWMVFGYLVLTWVVTLPETSFTNGMRGGVLQFIDGWLPYYVASRSIRSVEDFRIALSGLLLGALLLSVLAVFEVLRSWKLYMASIVEYGLPVSQLYKARGPFLRPGASVQDSIVIGTVVVIGMCIMLSLRERMAGKLRSGMLWAVLLLGLLASLSRAPWMAGVLLFFLFFVLDGKSHKALFQGAAILSLGVFVLSFFPAGKVIVDLLPFVGQTEQGSIDYRMNWFAASMPVVERNFWFGDVRALGAPELEIMRNGEGIVDLVNMFLAVLLYYGAIGLALFVGMFLFSLKTVRRSERVFRRSSKEISAVGRSILVAVVCIMLIIFTLSAISVVPIMIWTLVGLSAAYGFMAIPVASVNRNVRLSLQSD